MCNPYTIHPHPCKSSSSSSATGGRDTCISISYQFPCPLSPLLPGQPRSSSHTEPGDMGLYMMSSPEKPPGPILFKKLQWRKRFARSKAGLSESIRLDFVFSMARGGGFTPSFDQIWHSLKLCIASSLASHLCCRVSRNLSTHLNDLWV